jgi:hypothetical protein
VISAHNGRVNNILICETFGALVTVGSDGCLNCKMMTNCNPLEKWETFTLNLNYELCSESSIKLTCSCIVSEVLSHLIVSIGSSCGKLFLVRLSREDINVTFTILSHLDFHSSDKENTSIHTMCCCKGTTSTESNSSLIAVGHSNGLSICTVTLSDV